MALTDLEEVQQGLGQLNISVRREAMTWNYETISKTFSEMARENYEDMVKAFLAMELSVDNMSLLDTSIVTLWQ